MELVISKDPERDHPFPGQDEMKWKRRHWLKLNAEIWQRIVLLKQEKQPEEKSSSHTGVFCHGR